VKIVAKQSKKRSVGGNSGDGNGLHTIRQDESIPQKYTEKAKQDTIEARIFVLFVEIS
jgi:hypothetical protein